MPLRRFGEPAEVAALAAFLAADNPLTGRVITIDGGENGGTLCAAQVGWHEPETPRAQANPGGATRWQRARSAHRAAAIEEIRMLVAKYSLSLDMRDLDAHVNLLAPDIRVGRDVSAAPT